MRPWLIALGALAALLAAGVVTIVTIATSLLAEGQSIGAKGQLTTADALREQFVFVTSFALQSMIMPFAVGSVLSVAAILAVLARARQLRRPAPAR